MQVSTSGQSSGPRVRLGINKTTEMFKNDDFDRYDNILTSALRYGWRSPPSLFLLVSQTNSQKSDSFQNQLGGDPHRSQRNWKRRLVCCLYAKYDAPRCLCCCKLGAGTTGCCTTGGCRSGGDQNFFKNPEHVGKKVVWCFFNDVS